MRTVFADSFYFFALNNDRDSRHTHAVEFVRSYTGRMLTTVWVLMELGDGFCRPANRQSFLLTLDALRLDKNVTIVTWSDELFDAGVKLYADRPDKDWSLTDCISFVVMQRNGLTEALTGDRHFEQAGFIALLK